MTRVCSSFWREIYYESIVEHDLRLRTICTKTPWIYCERIIEVDNVAAKNDVRIVSHPIAIYLNKLAPKLQQYKRENKDLIYKQHKLVASNTVVCNFDREDEDEDINGIRACRLITINPRNRWFKLYERNPRFFFTTSRLLTQLYRTIQGQIRFLDERTPTKTMTRGFLTPTDKYPECYKVRIYHRQTWNHLEEGGSFPSVWKEPDPSTWIDDVSEVALRHITLLCRDMISECNKCTTGCPVSNVSTNCDACSLEEFGITTPPAFGSSAEGCMLPTFFVRNELNQAIKKCSDIDFMFDSGHQVGFNTEIESNIFATIETNNCKPGYLRLRFAGNGKIVRGSEDVELLYSSTQFFRIMERSCHSYLKAKITRGPATTNIFHSDLPNVDQVFYSSCSTWPPNAQTWVDRKRRSKWPPKEIIRDIVSKGCRIVHKAHPSSRDPDAEFRFSFSEAELILFNTISLDQKKCFIAFKALVKYGVCRSEFKAMIEIDLSSYILETIFLWSCETIPADQWQTTNGWAKCLFYMIDQLYACLKSKTLPGYFIPDCNLMDSIELPQTFFQEIVKLRSNPITYAGSFLDSTKCFQPSYFIISEHIHNIRGIDLVEEIALQRQLSFLQRIVIELDSTRGVMFWQKEAVLRIFAKWCQQNSHEIHLTPLQCLTKEMTLFDVVHLDIVQGFDVPNNVLLEYVDREWSVDVVCKLACCYSMKRLEREDHKNKVEHSLHFKTLLMIHHAMNHEYPSAETILTSVLILMRCKEYEMAAHVLESALSECLGDNKFIFCGELYADLFSQKMKNEIQELFDIKKTIRTDSNSMFQSTIIIVYFSLSMCYKYIGDEQKRESVLGLLEVEIVSCWNILRVNNLVHYSYVLLMLEVFENSEKWKKLQCRIFEKFVSMKIEMIEQESDIMKDWNEKEFYVDDRFDRLEIACKDSFTFSSCTVGMTGKLMTILTYFRDIGGFSVKQFDKMEHLLGRSISTTADKLYFSQFLITRRKLEKAVSLLKAIVEQEGDFSTSVVIWSKNLYECFLIDDNLRQGLIQSSEDYVVFPANLYARYLLTIAYKSLGQEENRIHNQAELIVLRKRYSRFREFAPVLKIMSTVS